MQRAQPSKLAKRPSGGMLVPGRCHARSILLAQIAPTWCAPLGERAIITCRPVRAAVRWAHRCGNRGLKDSAARPLFPILCT